MTLASPLEIDLDQGLGFPGRDQTAQAVGTDRYVQTQRDKSRIHPNSLSRRNVQFGRLTAPRPLLFNLNAR